MEYTAKRRASLCVSGLLVLALQVCLCGCRGNVVGQEETGIRGQVLRGPVSPGPQLPGEPSEAPFSAEFYVLYRSELQVARFRSDENGLFEVKLPSGDYAIIPDESAPLMNPNQQRKNVTVPPGTLVEVILRFDTGIR